MYAASIEATFDAAFSVTVMRRLDPESHGMAGLPCAEDAGYAQRTSDPLINKYSWGVIRDWLRVHVTLAAMR